LRLLGNIIWFIFGGFIASILWVILGILLAITIIGIPFASQCFKFAELVLTPFGKDAELNIDKHPIANILWAILIGWEMALGYIAIAAFFAITIIGIPFALQWIKLAKLALFPFGAKIK